MKKFFTVALILIALLCGYIFGAITVLHSEGWIDEQRQEFVVEFADNLWTWDISEE